MPSAVREFPAPADPLGETLHLLRLTGALYCRAELTAPWGVHVPRLEGLMMLYVVTEGGCLLETDGDEPRPLRQGSLTLVPHGLPHRLRSGPEARTEPLFEIPVEQVSERYEIMRHGGGGEFTHVTCAVVRPDHAVARRLVAQLPGVLHLGAWDDAAAGWLAGTLHLISREALALRPGGETVITRLADVLVVQAIRAWLDAAPEAKRGWLAALRDEQVGRALLLIHREPEREWDLAALAGEAGMSRSAFSARFTGLVGESAVHYLTRWRMQLAREHLRRTTEPLSAVARRFGYRSEAAFCRAFKRAFGVSPGSVRAGPGPAVPRGPAETGARGVSSGPPAGAPRWG
ncbi:AraC family transcriptional regulator [Planomonospora parontospora]|uniref:AraC family transcriptional regulator n=1 Tax=Planomonospora parontospora TaxID=58119 RepID=UPI001670D162|nr:AraC family transcriptional regulator [Planomonospora parontospora]GGL39500.1 AraC family transcriptional regulator [Planomonospora parontospora subsp. antibiotica]GII18135.1 AraC family transcriptional regulator [Planomonospora parontospora subsp. antibiotica]